MIRLALEFPAGRYHATPWGRHVNEGAIEWPPSPFRLLRALLAVGFNKLGWSEVPAVARTVIERLAAGAPTYWLPPAGSGHTRHYMPQGGGGTAKVIDAFAYPGSGEDGVLVVEWPAELNPDEVALLDQLVLGLAYLGRAESWVEVRRIEALPPGLVACAQGDGAPERDCERIPLLAPLSAEEYGVWRDQAVARELARRLEIEEARAAAKGRKPARGMAEKQSLQAAALHPPDLLAALQIETTTLQEDGWSQPPGTRWLSYLRPRGALSTTAPRPRRSASAPFADTALLALASDTKKSEVLPRLQDAILRFEGLHDALVKRSADGERGPSPVLSGKDEDNRPLDGHRHAFLLPLCLNQRDGRIDHVLIHAPMGFDDGARRALRSVKRIYRRDDEPELFVTLVGVGPREDFCRTVPALAPSTRFASVTPFIPPRFLKAGGPNGLLGQVQAELASRGLPEAISVQVEVERPLAAGVDWIPADSVWPIWRRRQGQVALDSDGAEPSSGDSTLRLATRWRHFRRSRPAPHAPPKVNAGFGLRLEFAVPVAGPIALGYASHFGLGFLTPAR